MNCIVTGGAGFIGSHLVDHLLGDGHEVTVLDNFSTGRPETLDHVRSSPKLSVHEVDIAEFETILPYFEGADWVFHIAALADIVPSIEHPLVYYRSNVDGTVNVLEASRRYGIKRFIYTASSSCYGIPDICPTPESADIRPQYPYALTKYLGEQCVMHWCQVYKIPAVSLRLFNVFGPRSRTSGTYGAVFGVFLAQKLHQEPFTVVGDGSQTRDFVFVTDVAQALVMAANSKIQGEIMNIGSGHTYSINQLVQLMGGEVVHVPKRPGEPDCTHADTTRVRELLVRELLGWAPQVTFDQGVARMIENIDYWREAPVWTPDKIAHATKGWFKYLTHEKDDLEGSSR
ncbi:MAG: SDR family oxidoreductase [Deltaproteobacteria bacterium]|nr:SDR family oxidoreductase [Deltaproteobacteria bacterium]